MNKIKILTLLAGFFFIMAFNSCSKFEDLNVDPLAASEDQVQVEYFINNSIVGAQMDPHIAERVFVLYWKRAARYELGGSLQTGGTDDGWSSDYWRYISGWLNSINTAVEVGNKQIANGTNKQYTGNLVQIARIWRVYLLSEMADGFGPIAVDAFKGKNPEYNSVKDIYYYMLAELKDATAKLDLNAPAAEVANSGNIAFGYKYDYKKWQKYSNSMRMRLAMRLSEVDPGKAQSEFEDAVRDGNYIKTAEETFDVKEQPGWDALTGVMSREWNLQYLSATLNNLYTNLGGIKSADQLPAELQAAVKPEGYIGQKFADFYPSKTNDPTVGYWLDGLPNVMDPRAYKTFIVPGWFDNPEFCAYPSWDNSAKTTISEFTDDNGDPVKTIDAKYTWNTMVGGAWGAKGSKNHFLGNNGTTPCLALKYRNSHNRRIFFGPWETYFLVAEAAERGWNAGMSGQAAYEAGIAASFEYHGVSSYLNDYLASTSYNHAGTSVNWNHTAEPGATHTMNYVDGFTGAPGTVDILYPVNNVYKGGAVRNDHITKIITQKYLAQVPWLPLEAWNDKRRLGLPFFENPAVEDALPNMPELNSTNFMTSSIKFYAQRLKYPSSLSNSSKDGYNQAVSQLGGPDNVFTPLWWAKQN